MAAETTRQISCPHCGAAAAPEDCFCRLCGASLAGSAETGVSRDIPYRHLFEHAAEALAIVDVENVITRVNQKFAQLAGLERAAIESRRRIEEFIVPSEKVRLVTGSGQTQALL